MNSGSRYMPVLDGVAHEMEHVLPGQASIRDFVHHNTLHGFQGLDFPDAVQAVQKMLGLRAHLPAALFTSAYRRGRVTNADVRAAIAEYFGTEAESPVAADSGMNLSHADVYHAAVLTPPSAPAPAALQWRIKEYRCMERLQAGVPSETRSRLLERAAANGLSSEAAAVRDLWLSCTTVVAASVATRAETAAAAATPPAIELDNEEIESLWSARRLKKEVRSYCLHCWRVSGLIGRCAICYWRSPGKTCWRRSASTWCGMPPVISMKVLRRGITRAAATASIAPGVKAPCRSKAGSLVIFPNGTSNCNAYRIRPGRR